MGSLSNPWITLDKPLKLSALLMYKMEGMEIILLLSSYCKNKIK